MCAMFISQSVCAYRQSRNFGGPEGTEEQALLEQFVISCITLWGKRPFCHLNQSPAAALVESVSTSDKC